MGAKRQRKNKFEEKKVEIKKEILSVEPVEAGDLPYRFEKITFQHHGIFDACIDATYILHLEGNGRYSVILEQLKKYKPSKSLYIVFNKGYKSGKKPIHINNAASDIIHANLEIFKHANSYGFGNILILEDDFTFNERVHNKDKVNEICNFIRDKSAYSMVYTLGCTPFAGIPCTFTASHYMVIFATTHACIFTKLYREKSLQIDPQTIKYWDKFTTFGYTYYQPLCYQTLPITENQRQWGVNLGVIENIFLSIAKQGIKLLQLDKTPEPGFSIMYLWCKCFTLILGFIIFCNTPKPLLFLLSLLSFFILIAQQWQK